MIADDPKSIDYTKNVLFKTIKEECEASWGWTNINDVIAKLLILYPFVKDDLVFAYWILLAEGKVWGTSPIVRVDNVDRVVWLT